MKREGDAKARYNDWEKHQSVILTVDVVASQVWLTALVAVAVVGAGAATLTQHARQLVDASALLAARVRVSHDGLSAGGGHTGVALDSQLAQAAQGVGVGVGAEGGGCHQTGAWERLGSSRGSTNRHNCNNCKQAQGLSEG